jgi:hypothetical protein
MVATVIDFRQFAEQRRTALRAELTLWDFWVGWDFWEPFMPWTIGRHP